MCISHPDRVTIILILNEAIIFLQTHMRTKDEDLPECIEVEIVNSYFHLYDRLLIYYPLLADLETGF